MQGMRRQGLTFNEENPGSILLQENASFYRIMVCGRGGGMSKYYIMGFTQNEVAQGLVIKQLNDFNEIMANNFKDAESRVRQGIRMEKIQLICYSINTIWIIDGKYNDDKYRKYLELVFANENLKNALEQQGIYYNYIESIEEKDLPSKKSLILSVQYFI